MKNINKNEEVVFDYAMVLFAGDAAQAYRLKCECGSPLCRGEITTEDWQKPELQEKYAGYFQYFLQEKIAALKK
jgi:uncharacterized protein